MVGTRVRKRALMSESKTTPSLARAALAATVKAAFLAYGLVRVGVGGAMWLQSRGRIDVEALREPLAEVGAFLEEHDAVLPFSAGGYLLYIVVMGLCLVGGSLRAFRGRGRALLWSYVGLHGALFVNFATVNRKVMHLLVAAGLLLLLQRLERGSRG